MKTKLFTLALAALTIGLLGSCKKEDLKVSVTGVTLDQTTLTLTVGDPDVKLTATVAPDDATDKTVSWSSDKTEFATVDTEGNVHAVAPGTANITVTTTDGGKTATCAVIVKAALPVGALPGVFSVSATKKVHFSKGNLYADGDKALHFEDAQWKSTPASEAYKDASHISHFTWSSTIEAAVGDSNSGDYLFCDESHKVSVDGSEAIYYALSKGEWVYLINNNGDDNIRKDKYKSGVTVCGKANCLILAPDDFTGSIAASYDATAWATAEAAGLVCLYTAGKRDSFNVENVGSEGYYWSSTASDDSHPYCVGFNNSAVYPEYNGLYRYRGCSVRLVTDVK